MADLAAQDPPEVPEARPLTKVWLPVHETPELAYLVEVESFAAKVGGTEQRADVALRVTSIFRHEDGVWRVVHRHADPITTEQPAESVVRD